MTRKISTVRYPISLPVGCTPLLMEAIAGEMQRARELLGGERLDLGGEASITVVHTPGHSDGSVAYVLDGPDWAFVGDAVQVCGVVVNRFPSFETPSATATACGTCWRTYDRGACIWAITSRIRTELRSTIKSMLTR